MKRVLISVFAVLLLLASCACAEGVVGQHARVANCNEYISLRYEPDTSSEVRAHLPLGKQVVYLSASQNGFACVATDEGWGYVLEQYLAFSPVPEGKSVLSSLNEKEYYNVNVFLSNFTEAESYCWNNGYYDRSDDRETVEFCVNHIWFNDNDKIEWIDEGEYNVRLSDRTIADVSMKYFDFVPSSLESMHVDHIGGYYYWEETGGHVPDSFAIITDLIRLSDGTYLAYFDSFGMAYGWNNDCCRYSLSQARSEYGERDAYGCAVLRIGDLSQYSSFYLEEFVWQSAWRD